MGLTIHRRISTKARVITTLLALFVLVAQPMYGLVASQVANAIEINGDVAKIYNAADLAQAAADPSIKNFSIKGSFSTLDKTVLSRNVNIDGNNNTITFLGTTGWHGEYVFQIYKTSASFKNITITGGDAAIYANGSTVSLQQTVNVSGNEFGGIEVSQGSDVTTPAILNAVGSTVVNDSEANAKPTAWVDKASVVNAAVNGMFTKTTHIGANQTQYYLKAVNADIAATNTTKDTTYDDVQVAINNAAAGDTIRLEKDITLANTGMPTVRITKALTFDGNGKTITAPLIRGGAGGENNTALAVVANDVMVKNLSTNSTNPTNPAHGIVVQGSTRVTGVALENIKITGATAGVIVNNSTVVIDNISTTGSDWYGVGVDMGAKVTFKGSNVHTETQAIKNDNTTISTVIDEEGQYIKYDINGSNKAYYVQGKLQLVSPFNNSTVKGGTLVSLWTSVANANHYVYESYNDAAGTDLRWRENFTTASKTTHNVGEASFYWRVTAVDVAGNKTAATPLWKVTVDNTAPKIYTVGANNSLMPAVTNIAENFYSNISFKFFDAHQVDSYTVNGTPKSMDRNVWSDGNYNNIKNLLVEGVNTIVLYDVAGNRTEFKFNHDSIKPVIEKPVSYLDGKLAENSTVNGTQTFQVIQTEDDPGEIYIEVMTKNSNGDWKKDFGKGYRNVNVADFTVNTDNIAEGLHRIKISTIDTAGNKDSHSFTFIVDRSGPSVSATVAPGVARSTSGTVELNVVATDLYSNISSAKYTLYNNDTNAVIVKNVPIDITSSSKQVNLTSFIDIAGLVDGRYRVQLHVNDALGKQGKATASFIIDNVAPAAPLITPSHLAGAAYGQFKITVAPATTNGGVIKSTTLEDADGNAISYFQDGNVYVVDTTVMKKNAKIVATAAVVDGAGNESTATETYVVDNGTPAVDVTGLTYDTLGNFTLNGTSGYGVGGSVSTVVDGAVLIGVIEIDGDWHIPVGPLTADTTYSFAVHIENVLGYGNDITADFTTPAIDTVSGILPNLVDNDVALLTPNTTVGTIASTEVIGGGSTEPGAVLGTQDVKDSDVLGASKDVAAIAPSAQGWKFFGYAWYWWLLVIAAVAAIWWWIAAARRRNQEA